MSRRNVSLDAGLTAGLRRIFGNRLSLGTAERFAYSYDGQPVRFMPDAVVHALTTAEVAATAAMAARHRVPVVARGAGSGMTGGAIPERGGIILNLERMNRVISLDVEDRIAHVQPGVVTGDLQELAGRYGLAYPPEPASAAFSTIGGNIAESAGGMGCVKYGLTKDFVAGLEFVTAAGDIVRTGIYDPAPAPFDVGTLLIGSEGTLGIITRAAIRLVPAPERRMAVLAFFSTLVDAAAASNAILTADIGPSALEFMDGRCLDVVRGYVDPPPPTGAGAALIVEIDGDRESVSESSKRLVAVLDAAGPVEIRSAGTDDERQALWTLRKSLSPAIVAVAPLKFNEDVCVPIGRIPDVCAAIEELGRTYNVPVLTFGHSGDGNIHVNFMTHWERPDEIARVHEAVEELFGIVVKLGGTLSGEHGIGISKRAYIGIALDEATIAYERKIKASFDPEDVLNPGKIFPGSGA